MQTILVILIGVALLGCAPKTPAIGQDSVTMIGDQRKSVRSCGKETRQITGTVVAELGGGKAVAMTEVELFTGFMEWGHVGVDLKPVPIHVDELGRFEFFATLGFSVLWDEIDGKQTNMRKEWSSEHFLFRVPGCQDHIILVDGAWKPHEVRLNCKAKQE